MKLTDEQIFDVAERHLPGKAHKVISSTDPDYAKAVEIPDGARWIVSEVHPEHTLSFAHAIEATVRQQDAELVRELVDALRNLYVASPTSLECKDFHHSKREQHRHNEECKPATEYLAALFATKTILTCAQQLLEGGGEPASLWRPIETAPKDGTYILLSDAEQPNEGLLIGKWKMDCWWGKPTPKGHSTVWAGATHWMPLPPAPTGGEPIEITPNAQVHGLATVPCNGTLEQSKDKR